MTESSTGPGPQGKVERLLEKYGLEAFGDYMVERWTAERADERSSLRALAREFNIRLLESELARVGDEPIEGTTERYYEALSDTAVSSGVRTQVRRSLEQSGIDIAELEDEFVSRQAVHTYLTKTRGVSQPDSKPAGGRTSVRETIDPLRERVRQVTVSKLERLRDAGQLTLGEFRVIVDIQVYCGDCGTQQSISALLSEHGCKC